MRGRVFRKGFFLTALAVFLMPAFILCSQSNLQAAVDFTNLVEISSQVTIVKSAARYNRRTRTFFFRITITNPGPDTYSQPIVAVIDDLVIANTSYNVTFMGTDDMLDIDSDGNQNPIYIVSNTHLAPGASVYKNIQVAFRDASGNLVRPCPFRFTIRAFATQSTGDTTLPKISINYPLDSTTIGTDTPEIIITYSDDDSGVNTGSLNALINTLDKSSLFTTTGLGAIYQTINEIAAGNNTIEVILDDNAGNSGNATSNFTVNLSSDTPLYAFSLDQRNWGFQSPADGTYSQFPIPSGLDILDFYIRALHLAPDGNGSYFSFIDQEGIYYSPGDLTYGLFMNSSELGVLGQYVDALYIDYSNIVYFSVVGSGDILQSSGGGTNTTYMSADALGISGLDLDALYMASDGTVYFSVTGNGTILQSPGDGTNSVFLPSSDLGVPGYDINSFSPIPDDTPPSIQINQPFDGSVTNLTKPTITVSFQENDSGINTSGLDLNNFTATINGTDYSSSFTVTATGATYQLTSDLPVGSNTATVEIKDKAGNAASAISNFTVAILRAIPGATPTSGPSPLTVHFTTDGVDPGGTIEIFRWDFYGDGSWDTYDTVAKDYNRTYNSAGTYNATLYVKSSTGASATASITITVQNNPPVATADVVPSNGPVPLTVSLQGSGSDPDGSIVLYEWDFEGDGIYDWSSSTTGNTTHVYTTEGTYHAVFQVTDNTGLTDTATATTTAVRAAPPGSPTATAAANPTTGNAPLNVNFNGTCPDPDIVLYEWDFEGDGTYAWSSTTTGNTSHTYNTAGTHVASFRVTDSTGLTGVDQILINVNISVSLSVASNTVGFLQGGTSMTASASSQYSSSYAASKAIDNNTSTMWYTSYRKTPYYGYDVWFEVTFDTLQKITGLTVHATSTSYRISRGRIEIYNMNGDTIFSQEYIFPNQISQVTFPAIKTQ